MFRPKEKRIAPPLIEKPNEEKDNGRNSPKKEKGGGGLSMGNMEATSFFAQLRRGMHGPIPRERSPSPVPQPAIEVVTVKDEVKMETDAADGDLEKRKVAVNQNSANDSQEKSVHKVPKGVGLMNLPFPPGMEAINKAMNMKLYDNLIGATEALKKNQKVSITKDLPMPPGKS